MPISLYVGKPRSGKSYGVTENVIVPALQAGRQIVTNLALKLDEIAKDYPEHRITIVSAEEMKAPGFFAGIEGGTVFCIDEAWKVWPSGMKVSAVPEEQLEFIRMHGHRVGNDGYTCEIVAITQSVPDIAAALRNVVDFTYRSVKLEAVGRPTNYRIDIYTGAPTGDNPPESTRVRQIFGTYKPEIFKYYRSHTKSVTGAAGNEARSDNRGSALKSAMIKYGLPASIIMMVAGIYFAAQFFKPENHHITKPPAQQPAAQQPAVTQPAIYVQQEPTAQVTPVNYIPAESVISTPAIEAEQVSIKRRESTVWRVAGFLIRPNNKSGQVSLQSPWSFRTVPFEDYCEFMPGGVDIQCEIDGEIITAWTGHQLGGTISLPARVQRDSTNTASNVSMKQVSPEAIPHQGTGQP